MSEYVVEKGIPLPAPRVPRGTHQKYPFAEMELGDSVFIPSLKARSLSNLTAEERKKGKRFAGRAWEQNGTKGVRVWRTA